MQPSLKAPQRCAELEPRSGAEGKVIEVAGCRMTWAEMAALMRRTDGRSRGLPNRARIMAGIGRRLEKLEQAAA